jgi:leader peptidase (prepilin peptidase)/N-methyltransferase
MYPYASRVESFLHLVGPWPAHLVFVAACIPLALIDQATHRLPDVIVLPLWGVSGGYFLFLGAVAGYANAWLMATVSMAVTVLALWLLAEFPGQPLGFGDVKLGGLIALHLGWHSPQLAVIGLAGAFVLGGVWVAGAGLVGKLSWSEEVAFGPWLIIGWFMALMLA